ncbi:hypothetical protein SCHPADRAFT_235177 [Schizopora paradoxa]|uniref:F-box domain-containing protein n=1 Tax=Schizopora paradoxa TaxID=27342 RepID=A0A0H2SFX0_9AGAM|nr:hypothetical protein SCHPADRAFT_235177 [Schizopora paradoxa]
MSLEYQWTANLLDLSDDILFILFESLSLSSLGHLSSTCKRLQTLVNDSGWASYYKPCKRSCPSLFKARETWNSYENLKYDTLTDRSWEKFSFIARPLSSPWPKDCMPSVACSNTHLVYGALRDLHFFAFTRPEAPGHSPGVRFDTKLNIGGYMQGGGGHDERNNITGLSYMPDGTSLVASFEDGSLMDIKLPDEISCGKQRECDEPPSDIQPLSTRLLYKAQHSIECLSVRSQMGLTLSLRGEVNLCNLTSGVSSNFSIGFRWHGVKSAHLSSSSPRYAALGTMDAVPLRIHSISESDISSVPSLALGRVKWDNTPNVAGTSSIENALMRARRSSDSVLAMSDPPPYFGPSGQVLVSGWVDGVVRIYDLRCSRRLSPSEVVGIRGSSTTVPTLAPVTSMYDRSARGIGTITSGGGAGCYIAATSLTESRISFWDVRAPRGVWSVRSPLMKDPSPVYTLAMESSRLFGATQRRPFVYDFGPGVTTTTYPTLEATEADGLKLQKNGIGYQGYLGRCENTLEID